MIEISKELNHLEKVPVDSLQEFQGDLKDLTSREYNKLKKSLLEFGFITPIFTWGSKIIDGHQRLHVMINEGWIQDVPILRISAHNEQDAKRKLLVISSQYGRITQEGFDEFTFDLDDDWLTEAVQFDALPLVFGDWEDGNDSGAGEAGDTEPQATEAEADKYQKIWQVKEGQIWQVGRHRIACIDCLDEAAVLSFLDGAQVNFVWNDPPYGIDIVAANGYVGGGEAYDIPFGGVRKIRGDVGGTAAHMRKTGMSYMESNKQKKSRLGSANAAKPFGSKGSNVRGSVGAANVIDVGKYAPVIGDDTTETAVKSSVFCLENFPDAMQVWWGGNYYASALPDSPCWLIWDKENTGNFADCEIAWTNHNGAARIFRHMWNGMVKASEHGQRRVHPTQKPVALARWAFEKYGDEGDVILDLFLGSGISVKAAEDLDDGRIVYGCDLAPAYIATILQWASERGITPELDPAAHHLTG